MTDMTYDSPAMPFDEMSHVLRQEAIPIARPCLLFPSHTLPCVSSATSMLATYLFIPFLCIALPAMSTIYPSLPAGWEYFACMVDSPGSKAFNNTCPHFTPSLHSLN